MQQPPRLAQAFLERYGANPLMLDINACAAEYGRPGPRNMHGSVAVIDVFGALTAGDWWFGTTYGEIRKNIQEALDHDECQAILLRIDSPGGSTDEAFETATFVAEAAKKKPMWAVADVNCYSAAYLLASQCDWIVAASHSGGIGSIGVYMGHVDYSGALDQAGLKVTLISAGEGKTNGNPYEPLSPDAKNSFQAEVDRQYDLFVKAVASGRSLTEKKTRAMGAVTQHGQDNAIASGLADAGGTFEEALKGLIVKVQKSSAISASASAAASQSKGAEMADTNLKAGAAANAEDKENPTEVKKKKAADDGEEEDEEDTKAQGMAVAQEIAEMCQMAGVSNKTAEMMALAAKGKSMGDIRKAILNAKAEASTDEIHSSVPSSTKKGTNPLFAAVDALKTFYGAQARMEEKN